MKRILTILFLLLSLTLIFAACDKDDKDKKDECITTTESITTAPQKLLTVTFDTNGGSEVPSQQVEKGEKISKPEDPERDGYLFAGWTCKGEEWSFIGYAVTSDIVLKANWTPIVYSISYNLNGGTNAESNPITYTIESDTITLAYPSRTGYDFTGWDITEIPLGSIGNKTITASWSEPIIYTITYDLNGGTNAASNPETYTVESDTINFANPVRTGYSFRGWSISSISHGSTENKTVTANWDAIFTVSGNSITGLRWQFNKIDIPSEIDGVSITSIGYRAFYNCSSLTSVTIPDSVTNIEGSAFYNCSSLTSITIPDSVTSIGGSAFAGCSSITSVYITDLAAWCGISFGNTTSNPLYYAHNLYLNGTLVTDLIIPDSVTSIGNCAFSGCSNLTSITIPDSVTSIGEKAFYNCSSLTSITIPDSVMSVGNSAFSDCENLQYNEYDNAYYLGNASNPHVVLVKAKDTSISSCTIHEQTKFIHSSAFYHCSSLTNTTIPDGVTSLGNYAFSGCSGLISITIPNSVTSIGNYAFNNCSSLTSITIPNSVTSIGDGAFQKCSCLTNITIPNSTTSIERYSFRYCNSLTSIIIPNSVTSIGNNAFYGCTNLTSVTIPDCVTSIEWRAFRECSSLTSITYQGTKAQWNSIIKESDWDGNTGSYTIACTDGDITKY